MTFQFTMSVREAPVAASSDAVGPTPGQRPVPVRVVRRAFDLILSWLPTRRWRERVQTLERELRVMTIALNHVGRGLQMVDGDGRIVVSNKQASEMIGVSEAFLATKPMFADVVALQWQANEFAKTNQRARIRFQSPAPANRSERYRRQRPNGRWIEVESVPLSAGGSVRTHTDVTERHEAEARITYLAQHDFVTGLTNRAHFQDCLDRALQEDGGAALLLLDLDRFKDVNDLYGHPTGDQLLKELARRLRRLARAGDTVARLGGDEFAILIAPLANWSEAEPLAASLVEAMREPFELLGKQVTSGVSVGIAAVLPSSRSPDIEAARSDLMQQADLALYQAKAGGRGRWRSFDPSMRDSYLAEQKLITELRVAVAEEQFDVFYQPIIDLRSRRVSAFEALLRWRHPERGLLAAGEFIAAIETSGLMVPLGAWVLRRACRDAASWPRHIRLLANMSPKQLGSAHLVETVRDALDCSGLPAERLELEITETALMQMSDRVLTTMTGLRSLGLRIALDDFGTGYSSLSHVRSFPFDTIKIDRSFVSEATQRRDCAAIVHAVLGLAHELGMRTIGEGVEQMEQVNWLSQAGCDEVQGFLFSRPHPAADVPAMLAESAAVFAAVDD